MWLGKAMVSGARSEYVATYGAFDFVGWVFYKDVAPTELAQVPPPFQGGDARRRRPGAIAPG